MITHQSNGDVDYKYFKYPGDYNAGILATLCQNNILSEPVSTSNMVVKAGTGATSYLNEKVTEYSQVPDGDIRPSRILEQRLLAPISPGHFTLYSGPTTTNYANYKIPQTFIYDGNSNLTGVEDEGGRMVTNIYAYNDKYIVASIVNGDPSSDNSSYTSFEDPDITRSGWTLNGTVSYNQNVPSPTGTTNLILLASNGSSLTTTNNLNTAKPYILSFWASNSTVSVSAGATQSKSGPTYNGFTYYEYNIAQGTSSVTLSNSSGSNVNIDEVRLYPSAARMKTTTYDALLGKTSECDENNRIVYYSYDNLGRLQFIKDEAGNVVKMYEYNNLSAAKQTGCPASYSNNMITEQFTRDNCGSGYQGGTVTYTVAAGAYTSTFSQQVADLEAEVYLLFNGQSYADANGSCSLIYYNVQESQAVTTQSCGPGQKGNSVTYTVPAGTYSSIISQADANQQALNDITANAQSWANSPPNISCSTDTAADWEWFPGDSTGPADPSYCLSVGGQLPPHLFVLAKDLNPNSPTYNQTQYWDYGPNNACPANTYFNAQQSQSFTRNNCSSGFVGSSITYTVPPGKYSSTVSQAAANQQALNDIASNGQNYANANGTCSASCSFSWQSPISGTEGNVTESNGTGSFTFVFLAPNTNYTGGTIGTISGACVPSATRTLIGVQDGQTSGRTWNVTINPSGFIQITLNNGSAASSSGPPIVLTGSYSL